MALAAYRHLLRAARVAFDGDERVLLAARAAIKQGFREKSSLREQDEAAQSAIKHAEEVASMLRHNVVQGRLAGDNLYRLRIHKDTERGDNDTIKLPGGKTVKVDGKTCADR